MRYALVLLLLGACRHATEPNTLPPIELLIAGQSNGVSPSNGEAPLYSTTGRVWVSDYYCEWETGEVGCYQGMRMVQPTATHTVRSNQAWILLGDSLHRLTGRDVYVYNVARGGRTTTQLLSEEAFPAFKDALRAHPSVCAVLWIQGESEKSVLSDSTYRNMKAMIDTTRALHPSAPWIVALNAFARDAQLRIIADGLAVRGPDIDSLRTTPDYFQPDDMEFSGPGFRAHASAWVPVVQARCH